MTKTVTNLLSNISKARDIIATRDLDIIHKNLYLFETVEADVKRQVSKYIRHTSHELDFNYIDLQDLSNEILDYIKDFKFTCNHFIKESIKKAPITDDIFNEYSLKIGKEMRVDTYLRAVYKTLAYMGFVVYLWSETDEKKPFDVQITECIRSFL